MLGKGHKLSKGSRKSSFYLEARQDLGFNLFTTSRHNPNGDWPPVHKMRVFPFSRRSCMVLLGWSGPGRHARVSPLLSQRLGSCHVEDNIVAAGDDTVDITGKAPQSFELKAGICTPVRLASLYNMEIFFRAQVYGDVVVAGTSYKKMTERDTSYLHTQLFSDRCGSGASHVLGQLPEYCISGNE